MEALNLFVPQVSTEKSISHSSVYLVQFKGDNLHKCLVWSKHRKKLQVPKPILPLLASASLVLPFCSVDTSLPSPHQTRLPVPPHSPEFTLNATSSLERSPPPVPQPHSTVFLYFYGIHHIFPLRFHNVRRTSGYSLFLSVL